MPRKPPMWKRRVDIPGPGALVEGHIRFSDENQRDTLTLESQKRVIIEYCARRKWIIVSWSIEDSVSGGAETLQARPQWSAHIAKIGKEVQASVCVDLYRWSRDPGSIYESLRRIKEQGGYWVTCDEQHALDKIETDSGAQFGLAVSAVTAKQQLSATSARTHMGKVTRTRKGLSNGPVMFGYKRAPIPPPPLGYDRMTYRVTERLPHIPDDTYVESAQMTLFDALVKIGELRADNYSYGKIADWLNERGIAPTFRQNHKTRMVTQFTVMAIQNFIGSLYPREFVLADGTPSGHGTLRDPENGTLLEGGHKAAWDVATCLKIDQVNAERRESKSSSRATLTERKRSGYYDSLARPYSGMLICADCLSPLQIHTSTNYQDTAHRQKVQCPVGGGGNIDELHLDADIFGLLHFSLHEHQQQQIEEAAKRFVVHTPREVDPKSEQRIIELRAERERWSKLYARGLITDDEVTEQLGSIKRELQELHTTSKEKVHPVNDVGILVSGQQWLQISELWEDMSAAEKGKMLSYMFEPRSIAVDMLKGFIVRVRPKSPFDIIISSILGREKDANGWIQVPLPNIEDHAEIIARLGVKRGIKPTPRMLGYSIRGKRFISESLISQMRELRQQGMSYKNIARQCHVAIETVKRRVD